MRYLLPSKLKINRSAIILLAALLVGGVAAFVAQRYLSQKVSEIEAKNKGKLVKVVVASKDLERGATVDNSNMAIREVPIEWAHSGAVRPEQFDRVDRRSLSYAIKGGEPLLWAMLEGEKIPTFSTRVANGRRAVTVPVDEINSISGMLEPGDRIDILLTLDQSGKKYLVPLLQNISVLAAGNRISQEGPAGQKRSFTSITIDASPDDARRVVLGRETGRITALLRNPNDTTPLSTKPQDIAALTGLLDGNKPALPAQPSVGDLNSMLINVPVIYGGRGQKIGSVELLPGSEEAERVRADQQRSINALEKMARAISGEKPVAPQSPIQAPLGTSK
jgi:pilus assembly protein CpaB